MKYHWKIIEDKATNWKCWSNETDLCDMVVLPGHDGDKEVYFAAVGVNKVNIFSLFDPLPTFEAAEEWCHSKVVESIAELTKIKEMMEANP